jgi:hypothetical protein
MAGAAAAPAAAGKDSKNETPPPPSAPQAPKGFRRVSAVDDAPWFEFMEGNLCHGHVEGRHVMQTDPPRAYYQVALKAPCTVRVGKGEEAKKVQANVGDIINLGETYRIEVLREKVAAPMNAGGDYDVWIAVGKKRKLPGAKTMWSADVQVQENRPPTRKVEPLTDATVATDEETPF